MPRTIRSTTLNIECLENREVPAVLYALTNSQRLVIIDSNNPSVLLGSSPISGLQSAGEKLTDIDVRFSTGGLYGRSDFGRLYQIDPMSGYSIPVSGAVATGASVGIDFDTSTDQLRVVTYSGRNLSVDPLTGSITAVGNPLTYVSGGSPHLSALGFSRPRLDGGPQLFGIDHVNDTLAIALGDPNSGLFATVGSLGFDITNKVGFDLDPIVNTGFITIQPVGMSTSFLGQIDLGSGAISITGQIGSTAPVILDIADADPFFYTGPRRPFETDGTFLSPTFPSPLASGTTSTPSSQTVTPASGQPAQTEPRFPTLQRSYTSNLSAPTFTTPTSTFDPFFETL